MNILRILYIFTISVIGFEASAQQSDTVCIRIRDKQNYETIPSATIQTDLNSYYTTDSRGIACFSHKEDSLFLKISSLGYKMAEFVFNINEIPKCIYLIPDIRTIEEIQINANYAQTHQTAVTSVLGENEIQKRSGESLAKSIESIAGVNLVQTGATISKPSINGMYGNRIVISNDNVRLASQQWGKDHAPEIDPSAAQVIEVIKGAEAVRYGPDAIGGVVKLRSAPLTYSKPISGNVQMGYMSNGKCLLGNGEIQGGFKNNEHWAWRLRGGYKNTGDTKTAEYYINNTGSRESNYLAMLGYNHKTWGVETKIQVFQTLLGVFYGSHIGNLEDLKNSFELGRPLTTYSFTRNISAPRQEVRHITASVEGFINNVMGGKIKWNYSYQNNNRKEFSVRRMERTAIPAVHMHLNTHNLTSFWMKDWQDWKSKLGFSVLKQINYNEPGTGVVPIIPNFATSELGIFSILNYMKNRWEVEGGIRFDYKNLDAAGYNIYSEKYGGQHQFTNLTYSLGASFSVNEKIQLRTNMGMAWRAPKVNELYSNGLHHGAGSFDIGDDKLKSEKGIKWINSFTYKGDKLNVNGDIFLQYVKNYIYHRPTGQMLTLFSGVYPVFKYEQSDAFLRGVDLDINYKFYKGFSYGIRTSLIYADDVKNNSYFPFIAPFNTQQELKYKINQIGFFNALYTSFSHKFTAKQTRYSVYQELPLSELEIKDLKEPITPASYHLFSAELGGKIQLNYKINLSISVCAINLFNTLYKDYTNSFRYYTHDLGRNIQLRIKLNF